MRPILEYATVIWCSSYNVYADRIERIQKRFLIFALRRFPRLTNGFILPSYLGRCELLNLCSLEFRRRNINAVFARDVICAKIDCSELLKFYAFYVPSRALRPRQKMLNIDFHRTSYGLDEPVARTSKCLNEVSELFDFNISRDLFKSRIRNIK